MMTPDAAKPVPQAELAAHLAGRLCHDMISPVSAIVSGLDLLEDPSAQDMREDAMGLIDQSARKLAVILSFARVAYGSSASAETFDPKDLETLTRSIFGHVRAELDWAVDSERLDKPAARALLNLAQLGVTALPMGGQARLTVQTPPDQTVVMLEARGARAAAPRSAGGPAGRDLQRGPARPVGATLLSARPGDRRGRAVDLRRRGRNHHGQRLSSTDIKSDGAAPRVKVP